MIFALASIQRFIGIMDISVIILFLVAILIGALIGFFKVILKIANVLCGFIFSLVFAERFSRFLGLFLRKPIYNHFYSKVSNSSALSGVDETGDAKEQLADVLSNYGLPKVLSKFISKYYSPSDASNVKHAICNSMASGITKVILTVLAFFILWIGLTIIFFILKKTIDGLRKNEGFRWFDGIMGSILMVFIFFVIIEIIFFVFTFADSGKIYNFFELDMRLGSHKGFPLARWFYEKNLVKAFMDMFF